MAPRPPGALVEAKLLLFVAEAELTDDLATPLLAPDVRSGYLVRLKDDGYARYHPELRAGLVGTITTVPSGLSAASQDRMLAAIFPVAAGEVKLDVRWFDLEVVDPRWLAAQREARLAFEDAVLHHLKAATVTRNEAREFVSLELEYGNVRPNDRFTREEECLELLESLKARNVLRELLAAAKGRATRRWGA